MAGLLIDCGTLQSSVTANLTLLVAEFSSSVAMSMPLSPYGALLVNQIRCPKSRTTRVQARRKIPRPRAGEFDASLASMV